LKLTFRGRPADEEDEDEEEEEEEEVEALYERVRSFLHLSICATHGRKNILLSIENKSHVCNQLSKAIKKDQKTRK
tara:strand:- start:14 stop:241 length:228 start_codon:yes stop_codon:yes gene_type:complete